MLQFLNKKISFSSIRRDLESLDSIGFTLIPQNTNLDFPEYRDIKYRMRRV